MNSQEQLPTLTKTGKKGSLPWYYKSVIMEVSKPIEEAISEEISISGSDLAFIKNNFISLKVKKRTQLETIGTPCKQMYYVNSGYIRVYSVHEGNESTLWIVGPGFFATALSSFIFQYPNQWNIETITDCTLLTLSRDSHFNLLTRCPKWMEFDVVLLSKAIVMMEDRLFSHLQMPAKERLNRLIGNNPYLFRFVPLQHIASLLGVSPETLSRLRKTINQANS